MYSMSDLIELFYMCITVMEMKLTEVIRVSGPRDMRRRKKKITGGKKKSNLFCKSEKLPNAITATHIITTSFK